MLVNSGARPAIFSAVFFTPSSLKDERPHKLISRNTFQPFD